MSARNALLVLCLTVSATRADTPTDAMCRAYLDEGQALETQKNHAEARARFHAASAHCGSTTSLVLIAGTYQEEGDLPHALAYFEAFLAAVGPDHEMRGAVEKAVANLRERVPADQRLNIAAELAAPTTASATVSATAPTDTQRGQIDNQVDHFKEPVYTGAPTGVSAYGGVSGTKARPTGFFIGGNLAYASSATMEVNTGNMSAKLDFPAVFAAELQAGYRVLPYLSLALAPQMLLNLKPNQEAAAKQFELFVQATGHIALAQRWDLDVFVAPGYGVLIIPDASNAKGFAVRGGGGPVFHVSDHLSVVAEISEEKGFQKAERNNANVEMKTSFFSLFLGVRLH